MNIQKELMDFLDRNLKESTDKSRNIGITTFYYGFGEASWPTYEETAKHFNVGTRERIRQILNGNFRDYVKIGDLPNLTKVNHLIQSESFWIASHLEKLLISQEFVTEDFSVKGLLNLINDVEAGCEYELYTPELKKASRASLNSWDNTYLIDNNEIKVVRALLKKAKGLPGRCGIANLKYLSDELGSHFKLIKSLIESSPTSWCYEYSDDFWFLYENRESTIINYSEKVFSFLAEVESSRLAEVYRNALDGRTHKLPYPPESVIKEYLETSVYFECNDGKLCFLGEPSKLTEIELDVLDYLREEKETKFPELRQFLRNKGYGDPHISKATSSSPMVYVNKSLGRTHYTYSLVGNNFERKISSGENERYKTYLRRLRELLNTGTDETTESKYRKEQYLLQSWLFKGKKQECCAICNRTFSVRTLVAAHKKKRSQCNDAERLDPYIVMPVCLMGCDYLYENRHILVKDGIIVKGVDVSDGTYENEIIGRLVGNKMSEKWLKGRSSYFEY
ncbi:hypothetical protein P3602_06595 [Vibrio parahaemolyticus]|nr:hypothetical protein [Vibrio parahaemolyticus]MDF4770865.1 hypothetical protein [Vibrio parahaemolyticus]MDF5053678.1 hypothetical protein [Vibrio parahaemolyticus]MDF5105220.1 hypothetical protein [Vibrio parahaemolyticus]MDF5114168.1 hypothetical protein [Vibrio parahaemolyticus]